MQRQPSQSPARVLAPLALAVCAVAFFGVILSSGSGSGGGGGGASATKSATSSQRVGVGGGSQLRQRTYTVKAGDTLGGIAAKTGVSVSRLQEINPGLDPQALVAGQKIKLRE